MTIVYQCRHCSREIGKLSQQMVDESMLGLDQLSSEDKRDMISYETNGDITIKAICDSCKSSLDNHPQYHELDHFIQ